MIALHLRVFRSHLETSQWVQLMTRRESINEAKEAIFSIGDIGSKQGYLPAGMKYFECALKIACSKGEENDDEKAFISKILNNIGFVILKQGMFEEAKEHHELAPNHLGYNLNQGQKSSREVADSFKKLGNVFYRLSHFDDAKDYFIRSLKMREELCGQEDAAVASSLNNLRSIYSVWVTRWAPDCKGLLPKITCLSQKTLWLWLYIANKMKPETHTNILRKRWKWGRNYTSPTTLWSLDPTTTLDWCKGVLINLKSMNCFKSTLSIRERVLGQEHPTIAEVLSNLGQVYMDLEKFQESKNCHFQARNIRMEKMESDHSELGDSILNLGMVFERCSELREAAYNYHQALEIYAKHNPVNHHLCQTAEECLKRVSQQVDLNNPSLNRYENFKTRIWSSMKKNFRRTMILNNSFAGSFFKRELCRIWLKFLCRGSSYFL